jgi:hypothetical protein
MVSQNSRHIAKSKIDQNQYQKEKENKSKTAITPGLAEPVHFLLILSGNAIPNKASSGGRGEVEVGIVDGEKPAKSCGGRGREGETGDDAKRRYIEHLRIKGK